MAVMLAGLAIVVAAFLVQPATVGVGVDGYEQEAD